MTDQTEPDLTGPQKAYNIAQSEMFQLAAYGHHRYHPSGEALTDEGKRQQRNYNDRIRAAREQLEAALLRLVAEHAETFTGKRVVSVEWLRSLADDPAALSLLAVRPDERDFDTDPAVPAVPAPATDRNTLRARIAQVLRPHASFAGAPSRWQMPFFDGATPSLPRISGWKDVDDVAEAVLAVLPATVDRDAVARVRALHQQYAFGGDPQDYCAHCNQISGSWIPWPCPTVQALDGEQAAQVRRLAEAQQDEAWDSPDARPGTTDHTLQQRRQAHAEGEHAFCGPECDDETRQDPAQDGEARHTGGNAEDCPACRPEIDKTVLYPWNCPGPTTPARSGQPETDPEAPPVCQGFVWIGQPFTTCDRCAQPAWEHDGEEVPVEGAGPFDTRRTVRPWKPGEADAIRAKWSITPPV